MAAKLDGLRKFITLDLPREAFAQPRIRLLDLAAVFYALVEHAVVVTDAVADHRQGKGRAAVEEARRETAEAAVAEAGIGFAVEYRLEVEAQPAKRFACLVLDAHAEQRVVQESTHEEFQRQVTHAPYLVAFHRKTRLGPALHNAVARRKHDGLVEEWRLGAYRAAAEHAAEVMREVLQDGIRRHRQTRCLQQLDIAQSQ